MKLLSAAIGLIATDLCNAFVASPFDCYSEMSGEYGSGEGRKTSDMT